MLPQSYPNYKTVHRRFQTWCRDEILRRVLTDVANELRDKGALDEEECFIDATFVMAKRVGYDSDPLDEELRRDGIEMIDRTVPTVLRLDSMAVPNPCPLGVPRPQLPWALSSSPASLSSSGDFEIGSN
jgi:hypothetical protein